jgi:hypothetical protein
MVENGAGPGKYAPRTTAWLTAAIVLPMNSVFGNGFGRIGDSSSLAYNRDIVLLLARHACLTVLSGIASPSSD